MTATNTDGCQLTESVTVVVHPNNNTPPYLNGINNTGEYTYFANDGDNITFNIPSFDNPDEGVNIDLLTNNTGGSLTGTGFQEIGHFTWQTSPGEYGVYTFTVTVCDENICTTLCQDYTITVIITCPQCPLDVYYENRSQATTPLPAYTKAPRKIVAGYSVDPSQVDGDVIVGPGENVTFEAGVLVDVTSGGFYVNGGTFIAQIVPNTCIDECDKCCLEWTQFTYDFIPNVFTPNGDGVNDVWYIPDSQNPNCAYNANGFELSIFNRWGYRIFYRAENENYCCPFNSGYISWNGYANQSTNCTFFEQLLGCVDMNSGDAASDGTYYYIVKFKIDMGEGCYHELEQAGDITLLTQTSQLSEQIFENQSGNQLTQPDGTTLSLNGITEESKSINDAFISIYPNPAVDEFTVLTSDHFRSENTVIEVFDFQGKLVLSDLLQSSQKLINFSVFSKGIYLVKVSGNGYSEIKRIVKN